MSITIEKFNSLDMKFLLKSIDKKTFFSYYNYRKYEKTTEKDKDKLSFKFEYILENFKLDLMDYNILKLFNYSAFKKYKFIPIIIIDFNIYILAANSINIRELSEKHFKNLKGVKYFKLRDKTFQKYLEKTKKYLDNLKIKNIDDIDKYFDNLIKKALDLRASDIHINLEKDLAKISFRVNDELKDFDRLDLESAKRLSRKIKLYSGLDISNVSLPQTGSIQYSNKLRIRAVALKTFFGETIVLRLFNYNSELLLIDSLNLSKSSLKLDKLVNHSSGLIVVSGATGSGKTSLIYKILNYLNLYKNKSIYTIESPVEIAFNNLSQLEVSDRLLTYEKALKAILRADPDVIMIDEILDSNLAKLAIRSSMTGHLVLTSLHLSTTGQIINRFKDLGIKKSFLLDSLVAVIHQYLINILCKSCRIKYEASKFEKDILGKDVRYLYKRNKEGCQLCRFGIDKQELILNPLEFDERLKEDLSLGKSKLYRAKSFDLKKSFIDEFKSLIRLGKIEFEEIYRLGVIDYDFYSN